ncbi:dockerin type I domain-containing protein [Paenibacillus lautus]|uniref:dockerin type I domain-containing protein n=1 Tax=Paenibacillus lautus TaxID=1401 RepID=UPI001C0FDB5D|nr:dockerin type I domain-containing protein [Paenibacillus lautus]MBU5344710.1 hypothetical protein [Paenibacillus lautus]
MKRIKVKMGLMVMLSCACMTTILPAKPMNAQAWQDAGLSNPTRLEDKVYGQPERLAQPIRGISIYDGAVGEQDGRKVMFTTVKGSPAQFNVVDMATNKVIHTSILQGGGGDAWHHEVTPDGKHVYVTSHRTLWLYSTETKEMNLIHDFVDEGPWSLVTDSKGNAYVGTYPGGKVFKYDLGLGTVTEDYGRMLGNQPQEYVRSIALDEAGGHIYAGTAHGQIIKLDLATGSKTNVAQPLMDQQETGFVYDMNLVDNRYIFARYSESKNMYVYDLVSSSWLNVVLSNVTGLHVTDSYESKVYFIADNTLKYYNLATGEIGSTGMAYGSGLRGADWVEIDQHENPDLIGMNLVTMQFGGGIVYFNVTQNKMTATRPVVEGTPLNIHVIEKGSDNQLFMSTLGAGTGAVYDPDQNQVTSISLGQADSMVYHDNAMYMGVYPKAYVHKYDQTRAPGNGNPSQFLQVDPEAHQDRLIEATSGGGRIYFGSVSAYGVNGGAVTIIDPGAYAENKTGVKVIRNVVQDQSVVGLAYKDGIIFGSTNINNGLGSNPTAEEAKMFTMNALTGEKLAEWSPQIEGIVKPEFIGRLTVGPHDGLIWGAVNGTIFAMDPDHKEIVKSKQVHTGSFNYGAWSSVPLKWDADGILYALFGSKLIAIDPVTLEYREVTSAYSFTIGDDGYLYYSDGTDRTYLSRIQIGSKATIPEDVDGNGTVDHHDIRLVARHIGKEPVGDLRKLDVNQDGKINAEDVRRVTAKMNEDRKQK